MIRENIKRPEDEIDNIFGYAKLAINKLLTIHEIKIGMHPWLKTVFDDLKSKKIH